MTALGQGIYSGADKRFTKRTIFLKGRYFKTSPFFTVDVFFSKLLNFRLVASL